LHDGCLELITLVRVSRFLILHQPTLGARGSCHNSKRTGAGLSRRSIHAELTEHDLARLEQAFPRGATAGDRYSNMTTVDV
jgi:hypothetical protein